ncbi:hypothetical protein GIB67_037470 [Kingdonia uniflora]|uniref:GOST seven transmembrane domain-containing protein n=1 Tax=Kingdonia uniflora TaxID=39325 RepID=A0A7J7MYR4_9MAGN|nr:hypothetical protein GIB67_037470 [Kingdonia uniflora]
MIVIPLQVSANLASIVIGESRPLIKASDVLFFADLICFCLINFPIAWSIRSLRETSKTDGKAARNLAKLKLFKQFYFIVVMYLYNTRIVVSLLKTFSAYKYEWVTTAAEETASLVFYLVIFYMFRPVEMNKYFVLDEEEEEEWAAQKNKHYVRVMD